MKTIISVISVLMLSASVAQAAPFKAEYIISTVKNNPDLASEYQRVIQQGYQETSADVTAICLQWSDEGYAGIYLVSFVMEKGRRPVNFSGTTVTAVVTRENGKLKVYPVGPATLAEVLGQRIQHSSACKR